MNIIIQLTANRRLEIKQSNDHLLHIINQKLFDPRFGEIYWRDCNSIVIHPNQLNKVINGLSKYQKLSLLK